MFFSACHHVGIFRGDWCDHGWPKFSDTLTLSQLKHSKVASFNTSHLEAYAGFFRLLMKGIFDPYVLCPFDKKLIS